MVLVYLRQLKYHCAVCGINCHLSGLFLGNLTLTAIMQFSYRNAVRRESVSISLGPVETQSAGKVILTELEVKFHLLI